MTTVSAESAEPVEEDLDLDQEVQRLDEILVTLKEWANQGFCASVGEIIYLLLPKREAEVAGAVCSMAASLAIAVQRLVLRGD